VLGVEEVAQETTKSEKVTGAASAGQGDEPRGGTAKPAAPAGVRRAREAAQ